MPEAAKKSKKNRKAGRNSVFCKHYAATFKGEKNKILKLEKRLRNHPNDECAVKALALTKALVYGH